MPFFKRSVTVGGTRLSRAITPEPRPFADRRTGAGQGASADVHGGGGARSAGDRIVTRLRGLHARGQEQAGQPRHVQPFQTGDDGRPPSR